MLDNVTLLETLSVRSRAQLGTVVQLTYDLTGTAVAHDATRRAQHPFARDVQRKVAYTRLDLISMSRARPIRRFV